MADPALPLSQAVRWIVGERLNSGTFVMDYIGNSDYLFAGSDAGGRRAAAMYSLIETAKLNGIDPQAYLADLRDRIGGHPAKRIAELLPWTGNPPSIPAPQPEPAPSPSGYGVALSTKHRIVVAVTRSAKREPLSFRHLKGDIHAAPLCPHRLSWRRNKFLPPRFVRSRARSQSPQPTPRTVQSPASSRTSVRR